MGLHARMMEPGQKPVHTKKFFFKSMIPAHVQEGVGSFSFSILTTRNEIHAPSLRFRCISAKAKFRDQNEEDIDVARERRRVLSGSADSDVLRLENLTKV